MAQQPHIQGQGWGIFQPGDDEDEAMIIEIMDDETGVWARHELVGPNAIAFWRAVEGAVGNIEP